MEGLLANNITLEEVKNLVNTNPNAFISISSGILNIFIGMLETIHPEDAKLVVKMINREKIDGLTRVVVEEAFPGLLRDSEK